MLIGILSYAIHKHSCRSQHISVLTTSTSVCRRVCTIEPSFCNTTSGMHPRPFEGRHLVSFRILKRKIVEQSKQRKIIAAINLRRVLHRGTNEL